MYTLFTKHLNKRFQQLKFRIFLCVFVSNWTPKKRLIACFKGCDALNLLCCAKVQCVCT